MKLFTIYKLLATIVIVITVCNCKILKQHCEVSSTCENPIRNNVCCTNVIDYSEKLKLLPMVCGHSYDDGLIVKMNVHPWTALLKYRQTDDGSIAYRFGGSLINDRYVIIAAHFLPTSGKLEFMNEVRLGEFDINSATDCMDTICSNPPLDIGVEQIIMHKDYILRLLVPNDIALLRLATKITFTDYIQPICLPIETEQRSKSYDEVQLTIVGWKSNQAKEKYGKKIDKKLYGTTGDKCDDFYKLSKWNMKINIEKQLCTNDDDGENNTCLGSLAGPLMHQDFGLENPRWTIIGIPLFGARNCTELGKKAVYTRVDGYISWILKHIHE